MKFFFIGILVYLTSITHAQTLNDFVQKGKEAAAKGNYAEAERIYREAYPVVKKQEGEYSLGIAIVLNNLASACEYQEKFDEAEKAYKQSLPILAKEYGDDSSPYATVLDNLSGLYMAQEKYGQVEEMKLRAYSIRKKAYSKPNPSQMEIERYALSCNNLGEFYRRQGLNDNASKFLTEALSLTAQTQGKENRSYAIILDNLALMYMQNGLYAKAEPLMVEAKEILARTRGKQDFEYAIAISSLSSLYENQGLLDKAIELAIEAKDIKAEKSGKESLSYALSLNNIAGYYMKLKNYKEAERYLEESKEIHAKKLGLGAPSYGVIVDNLAQVYSNLNKTQKAIALFKEAKEIAKDGADQVSYANLLNNFGTTLYNQNEFAEAESHLLEAHDIYLNKVDEHHDTYGSICRNLAMVYERIENYDKAEHFFKQAIKTTLLQFEYNFSSLSEKEKETFYNKFSKNFYYFYDFATKHMYDKPSLVADVFNYQLQIKAILFKTSYQMRARILASNNTELQDKYKDWKSTRDKLSKLYQLPPDKKESRRSEIATLEKQVNELEKQLALQSSSFARSVDKETYTWQDVQKKLKKDEAVVEVVRLDLTFSILRYVAYMALVMKPDSQYPEAVLISNGEELEGKFIKNYRNSIKFKSLDKFSYEQYWKRIADVVRKESPEIKKVYLSPDGVYHTLNVNTLYNPTTRKYVQDEWDVQLLSNVSDLLKTFSIPTKNQKEVVLMGFPNYNQENDIFLKKNEKRIIVPVDTSQRFFNGEDITELLGTKKEVESLQGLLQKKEYKTTLYTEAQASEEVVKNVHKPYILHIATHGFFLPTANEKDELQNPLLRSGLLFSGAKNAFRYGSDGILTAYEALTLELEGTDLVVLSACETGLGEIKNGEGVYGLQRAFQQAGAKAVLMSLWTVSDNATQELMTNFYQNWITKKQPKRLAFQNAQNELKKKFPEPFYWGAFVMVGE